MGQPRFSIFLFTTIASILQALLSFWEVKNAHSVKALIRDNALKHGYWVSRSMEIGHSMMLQDHVNALRNIITDIVQKLDTRFLVILDAEQQVIIASGLTREGVRWPDDVGTPPETGRIIRSNDGILELVFPAFFAKEVKRMPQYHPNAHGVLADATQILLGLDVSEELAHYRASVIQSVIVSLSVVILGLVTFWFLGMIQRYRLASMSLVQLGQINHSLERFVPGMVQKLIEENPAQPLLDKVEREVTVLFLDIDQYTTMAAEVLPGALNYLIETYFSAFLDIILSHGSEINQTAGDSIMAIFPGKTAHVHAFNAVKTAVATRTTAAAVNLETSLQAPEILVNIGINTGQVLPGATMIKGAVGERWTYTASGMVTNIAARLFDLGAKGEIHLGETTALLASEIK